MQAVLSTSPYHHHHHRRRLPKLLKTSPLPHLHQLHALLLKTLNLPLHPFLSTKLLAAASLLDLHYAHSLLPLLSPPPLFAINSLLRGHSLSPNPKIQLTFSLLNSLPLPPDRFTFVAALKSCARARALSPGRQIHASAVRSPHYPFLHLRNALLHLYSSCEDSVQSAYRVFDEMSDSRDAVSWSILMNARFHSDDDTAAVTMLFNRMKEDGLAPNAPALVVLLSAAGEPVHGYCVRSGHYCSDLKIATAVAKMYVRVGCLDSATRVFDEVGCRDVVLYNCVIDGYAKGGFMEDCLDLLWRMKRDGLQPNASTFVGMLSACASHGALVVGRKMVGFAREEGLELDAALGTAALDMYVKCGCIDAAIEVFRHMRVRDVKAWTAMIMGLGIHGRVGDALEVFREMEEEEQVRPNEVTFLAVLNACSHGGMVDEGRDCFDLMVRKYKITPGIEQYGCVIDLLGRAGLLEEAYLLIKSLPLQGDATAWRALLAACRVYGDVRHAELAQQALVELGDNQPTDSILLSSTYVMSGRGMDIGKLRDLEGAEEMLDKKEAGCSLIEVNGWNGN